MQRNYAVSVMQYIYSIAYMYYLAMVGLVYVYGQARACSTITIHFVSPFPFSGALGVGLVISEYERVFLREVFFLGMYPDHACRHGFRGWFVSQVLPTMF